jgi:hypothetical protein
MWIDPETGDIATTHAQVRALRPNWSGPSIMTDEMVADLGFVVVNPVEPTYNPITQKAVAEAPKLVSGQWQQSWKIVALTPEEAAANRKAAVSSRWSEIMAYRDGRQRGGVLVDGKWFHSDDSSRIQQISLVMVGPNIPLGLQWKTMDGSFVTMTPELAGKVFSSSIASDQAIFACAERHRTAMSQSADPATYNFYVDWPPIYGEAA